MAQHSRVLIQGGKTPGGRMHVTVPVSHTYAAETARAQYNFEGAQYIWQNSWEEGAQATTASRSSSSSSGGFGSLVVLGLGALVLTSFFGGEPNTDTLPDQDLPSTPSQVIEWEPVEGNPDFTVTPHNDGLRVTPIQQEPSQDDWAAGQLGTNTNSWE